VAVLGDMLELGKNEKAYHLEAGRRVAASGWDLLVAIGPLAALMAEGARAAGMAGSRVSAFDSADEAAPALAALVNDRDLILVKGSRGVHLDRIADRLTADFKET
jgi:UDP-N-acetylmuramyl pentapeptide synthase